MFNKSVSTKSIQITLNVIRFGYFTQIAFNCFRQKIKNEKKYGLTKQKLRDEKYTEFEELEGLNRTQDNDLDD